MSKRAVIVVDIQNEYFAAGKLPLVNIEQAAANAARVIAMASTFMNLSHLKVMNQ